MVSVIIPNYNYSLYLTERIESVLNQSYQDFELILLDDASSDESAAILNRYKNHPKVSHLIINETNSGSTFKQWELGINLAKGKYIWIAEADDSATPDFLEKCVSVAISDPDISIVKPMSFLIDGNGDPSSHEPFDKFEEDGSVVIFDGNQLVAEVMLERNYMYNASMILFSANKYKHLTNLSYKNFRYAGDWLFWGLMALDSKVAEIHSRLNKFRFHGKSVTDTGHRERGLATLAESHALKASLCFELKDRGYTLPTLYEYKLYRDFGRDLDSDLTIAVKKLSPQLIERIKSISKAEYRKLWIRKHLGLLNNEIKLR